MDFELYPFEDFSRREVIKNVFINFLRGISTETGNKPYKQIGSHVLIIVYLVFKSEII